MPKPITYTITAVALFLLACQTKGSAPKEDDLSARPKSFAQIEDSENEIFPLANGNAYLVNQFSEQLFLISKAQALRVKGVQMRGFETSIFPLPDGSAYLTGSNGRNLRVYHLVDANAFEVKEVPALISEAKPLSMATDSYLWCQLQSANMRVRRTNAKLDQPHSDE